MADKRSFILHINYRGEIRRAEEKHDVFETKKGGVGHWDRIDLYVDDEDGERIYLEDKCLERASLYKRGVTGTFKLKISCDKAYGIKAKIEVLDFVPDK